MPIAFDYFSQFCYFISINLFNFLYEFEIAHCGSAINANLVNNILLFLQNHVSLFHFLIKSELELGSEIKLCYFTKNISGLLKLFLADQIPGRLIYPHISEKSQANQRNANDLNLLSWTAMKVMRQLSTSMKTIGKMIWLTAQPEERITREKLRNL